MKEIYSAYYYSFESTGIPEIDEILKEIASAGKGCRHTEDWNENGYIEKIQLAANNAAQKLVKRDLPCIECGKVYSHYTGCSLAVEPK